MCIYIDAMPLTHAHIHHAVDGRVETPVSRVQVSWWWIYVAFIASYA